MNMKMMKYIKDNVKTFLLLINLVNNCNEKIEVELMGSVRFDKIKVFQYIY